MDDSNFPSQLKRTLYQYRKASVLILRSRTFTLAKNIRVVVKAPNRFAGKAARLLVSNPGRLVQIATGRRTIQNVSEDQAHLTLEYQEWIEKQETPNLNVKTQREQAKQFKEQPLVSLITPVFNPPVGAHNELIESVLAQTYGNFELLLFNFGDNAAVRELLDAWAKKDRRIVVKHDLPNGGISKNSNLSLKYAKGEYVGLLDHDDALEPNALFECVKAINETGAEFIYTDKDKITEDGIRHEAFFKPGWSPEMLLGGNYLTHFDLMKTDLVRRVGAWDPETDGAQDWDLFLRIMDETDKIAHVPHIAYHWRTVSGSTAVGISVKPYALAAQRKAVNKHLKKHGLTAEAKHEDDGQMYVHWDESAGTKLCIVHLDYGDIGHAEDLIARIVAEPDFGSASRVVLCVPGEKLPKKQLDKLYAIYSDLDILQYETGQLAARLSAYVSETGIDDVVYISDSVFKVKNVIAKSGWLHQLCGWLSIPEVGLAGGAAYSENGQLIDIGSFFDPASDTFEKYYFSTGFRSGYNGYVQWIRNFVLPCERVVAFKASLMREASWKGLKSEIRDDELIAALSLVNYASDGRAVYDPAVSVIDNAPFYAVLPVSTALRKFVQASCKTLKDGDPYYNPNLNDNYMDPQPLVGKTGKSTISEAPATYRVRSTDSPNY
jgi:hypothetical protein